MKELRSCFTEGGKSNTCPLPPDGRVPWPPSAVAGRLNKTRPPVCGLAQVYLREAPWPSAQSEIRTISAYKTPRDKVQCILRMCSTIMNLLSLANEDSVPGADDFVPVLVFVLIKVRSPVTSSLAASGWGRVSPGPERTCLTAEVVLSRVRVSGGRAGGSGSQKRLEAGPLARAQCVTTRERKRCFCIFFHRVLHSTCHTNY